MNRRVLATVAAAALALTLPSTALAAPTATTTSSSTTGTAGAGHPHPRAPQVRTLTTKVTLPFGLAVNRGRVYVADGATATVSRLAGSGLVTVAQGTQGPGNDVAGLAFSRDGRTLAFTSSVADHSATTLELRGPRGASRSVSLAAYEATANPDQGVSYGIDNPTDCQRKAFEPLGGATYRGSVDSHPYAVAAWGRHSWIVADAGGNDLVRVDRRGRVSTVAVLPRQPYVITAAAAKTLGLPDCVVGATYNFEPVPTGVEVGRDGWLYVSILAGGPEDPSLGARSKIYRVNPRTGRASVVARHLSGATNLVLGSHGRIYVTEYYSGEVSVVERGRVRTLVQLPRAVSIARGNGALYVGTTAEFGPNGPVGTGSVVAIR